MMPLTALERKAEMVLRQVTQQDIANGLGLTQSHVSEVIRGKRRSPRVEQAVAEALGRPVEEVFGAAETVAA
jgi:transcriptional regulator with XRE-family HTH domain